MPVGTPSPTELRGTERDGGEAWEKGFPWGLVALSDSLGPLDACEVVEAVERSETDEGNLSLWQNLSRIRSSPHPSALRAATFPQGEG